MYYTTSLTRVSQELEMTGLERKTMIFKDLDTDSNNLPHLISHYCPATTPVIHTTQKSVLHTCDLS